MTKMFLASAVSALALVAAGCGGGNDETTTSAEATPTAEWADGFCTAITTWTDSLKSVTEQFTDLSSFSQEGLESAADDVKDATEALADDLKGLGAPDTESGQAVKDSLDELTTTAESEAATVEDTVQGVSDVSGIPEAATSIQASLTAMSTAFNSTLQTVEDADVEGELQTALEDSPACADISS